MLMSAVSSARRQAQTVTCLAKQCEIGNGASIYLQTHRGFLPLAGALDTVNTPEGVDDADYRKYQWETNPKTNLNNMLPFHKAVGLALGNRIPDGYIGMQT